MSLKTKQDQSLVTGTYRLISEGRGGYAFFRKIFLARVHALKNLALKKIFWMVSEVENNTINLSIYVNQNAHSMALKKTLPEQPPMSISNGLFLTRNNGPMMKGLPRLMTRQADHPFVLRHCAIK